MLRKELKGLGFEPRKQIAKKVSKAKKKKVLGKELFRKASTLFRSKDGNRQELAKIAKFNILLLSSGGQRATPAAQRKRKSLEQTARRR